MLPGHRALRDMGLWVWVNINPAEGMFPLLQCVTAHSEPKPDLSALHKQGSLYPAPHSVLTPCLTEAQGSFSKDGAEENSNIPNLINHSTALCDMSICHNKIY